MPTTIYRLPRLAVGCAVVALTAALSMLAPSRALAEPVSLAEALARASSTSPIITAAEADVAAAQGRAQQAGFRPNPELDLEVENFAGTGGFSGLDDAETTLAIGQRFELGGKRSARRRAGEAEVEAVRLRLEVARADLERDVPRTFQRSLRSWWMLAGSRPCELFGRAPPRSRPSDGCVQPRRNTPRHSAPWPPSGVARMICPSQ
jgi:outer membrane protein TolC